MLTGRLITIPLGIVACIAVITVIAWDIATLSHKSVDVVLSNSPVTRISLVLERGNGSRDLVISVRHVPQSLREPSQVLTTREWRSPGAEICTYYETYGVCYELGFSIFYAVVLIGGVVPLLMRYVFRVWRQKHRRAAGLCLVCGYDLRCTPNRCPECGQFVAHDAAMATGIAISQQDLTWHHSEIMGVMVFTPTTVNQEPHTGGVRLWEIIHGEEYR